MQINRRVLRSKLGSRSSRRQGTKRGKVLKPKPRTKLAEIIRLELAKQTN